MSKRPANHRMQPRSSGRLAGFTLIELMIAMILGLIVIAGVTSIFLAGQQSFRTNNALADVQDSSRISFELMARDIRQAGLSGCNSMNGRITNVLNSAPGNPGTPVWWADWGNAVRGYDDATTDPAVSAITGNGAPVKNTSSVELIGAGNSTFTIETDVPGTNFTLNSSATGVLAAGDIIMACSPDHATILQITGPNSMKTVVIYNTGNSVSPGNCSNNLGYPNDACTGNSPQYAFPPNSKIAKLSAVDWYIGTNLEGGTSLFRVALQNKAGTVTGTPQEMVRNVTAMTIGYLDPSVGAIGNQFVDAAKINASSGWANVTAVRVTLTMQSNFGRASVKGDKPIQRIYAFTTTLRNRVN